MGVTGGMIRGVMNRGITLLIAMTLLASCSLPLEMAAPAAPGATTPSSSAAVSTAARMRGLGGAVATADAFVAALNAGDYAAAHALLDSVGRSDMPNAASLQAAYDEAHRDGRTLTITTKLVGGLLVNDDQSISALLEADWDGPLLGRFQVTTTLTLVDEGGWRVHWTRDAIAPGFEDGRILLQQNWLPRASLTTADGVELVGPAERSEVGVQRDQIADAAEEQRMLEALSKVCGLSPEEIHAKYADSPANWFVPIAVLPVAVVDANSELLQPFAAVTVRSKFVRERMRPDLAPHLIGSVGPIPAETVDRYRALGYAGDEQVGLSGMEAGAEALLAGQPERVLYVASSGKLHTLIERPALRGTDVALTIGAKLQSAVQALLDGRRGAIVVLRPQDGSVLAMASAPTFDPTNVKQSDVDGGALLNRATQGLYPPGSTFKMVTMAAGLGEGIAQPDTVFNDLGTWSGLGPNFTKKCWRAGGHGRITLQNGLTASCNVVFYELGLQLENKGSGILGDYARRFGFGALSGLDMPGEQAGTAPDPDYAQKVFGMAWRPGDTVNMAVGQGYMLATPLQIVRMTAAIAAGGNLRTPHLIGSPAQLQPEPRALPLSASHLVAMQAAMLGVTTNAKIGTTAYRFADFNYYEVDGRWVSGKNLTAGEKKTLRRLNVAGKSGTAQAPGDEQSHAWFTAYAPADAPEIAVTVLLENAGQGSGQAGPLARQAIEAYFGLPISPTPKDALPND